MLARLFKFSTSPESSRVEELRTSEGCLRVVAGRQWPSDVSGRGDFESRRFHVYGVGGLSLIIILHPLGMNEEMILTESGNGEATALRPKQRGWTDMMMLSTTMGWTQVFEKSKMRIQTSWCPASQKRQGARRLICCGAPEFVLSSNQERRGKIRYPGLATEEG